MCVLYRIGDFHVSISWTGKVTTFTEWPPNNLLLLSFRVVTKGTQKGEDVEENREEIIPQVIIPYVASINDDVRCVVCVCVWGIQHQDPIQVSHDSKLMISKMPHAIASRHL